MNKQTLNLASALIALVQQRAPVDADLTFIARIVADVVACIDAQDRDDALEEASHHLASIFLTCYAQRAVPPHVLPSATSVSVVMEMAKEDVDAFSSRPEILAIS